MKTYTFREPHPIGGWAAVEVDEKDVIEYMKGLYPQGCEEAFLLDEFKIIYSAIEYNSEEDKLKYIIDHQRRFIDHLESFNEKILSEVNALEDMITSLLKIHNNESVNSELISKIESFLTERKEDRIFSFKKRLKSLEND